MSEVIPESVGNAFTKKIGPLPGFAWVLIIVGVAYGVYWFRKRGTASTTGSAALATPVMDSTGFSSAGPAPGTNNYSGAVQTFPVGQPAVSTNAMWAKSVTDFLVGTGHYSGSDVSNALSKYLGGSALTDAEKAIVDTAVKQFQTPPEGIVQTAPDVPLNKRWVKFLVFDNPDGSPSQLYGVTPGGVSEGVTYGQWAALGFPRYERIHALAGADAAAAQNTAPKPTTVPGMVSIAGAGHSYTLMAGDTPASLALKFYGSADASRITGANPGAAFHPGDVITVP